MTESESKRRAVVVLSTNGIITLSVLVILCLTLYPYSFHGGEKITNLAQYFHTEIPKNSLLEPLLNIILFTSLGLGLTSLFQRTVRHRLTAILIGVTVCFCFSSTIEVLQVFLPSRHPSLLDVALNSLGSLIGALTYPFWRSVNEQISLPLLLSAWIPGLTIHTLFFVFFPLYCSLNSDYWSLTNWDPDYPLVLKNEATGNRTWSGNIYRLIISGHALTNQESVQATCDDSVFSAISDHLIGYYRIDHNGFSSSRDSLGNLPNLNWHSSQSTESKKTNRWLMTDDAVRFMSSRMRRASQFSILLSFSADTTFQYGPARIFSVSKGPSLRNLTIGQEGDDLVVRIRTPLNGLNGATSPWLVRNYFSGSSEREVILSYRHSGIELLDCKKYKNYSLNFSPETKAVMYLLYATQKPIFLGPTTTFRFTLLYYGWSFIPIGFFLPIVTRTYFHQNVLRRSILRFGAFLLPPTLQLVFFIVVGVSFSTVGLLLGIVMIVIGGVVSAIAFSRGYLRTV